METLVLVWIVTYLLHSTILVLGAWLLERRWADRPERMSGVWKTALVGGLLTASLQIGLGVSPVAGQWALRFDSTPPSGQELTAGADALAAPAGEPVSVPQVGPAEAVPALASWPPPDRSMTVELAPQAAVAAVPVDAAEPTPAPEVVPEREPAVLASTAEASSFLGPTARRWLLALLGLGSLLGVGSVLIAFVGLRRELRGRRRLRQGSLPVLLERLRRRARSGRRVALTEAPRVAVPMAVGVLRPEIVVPTRITAELSLQHQESLLAHELAHVLRRDPLWRLIALSIERVLFFQPLNRLASRRISQAAEYLCDDWAAKHTRQPLALASCLTEIATWVVARPGPVAATMSGPRSILGRRVHRLLEPAASSGRPWWLGAALALPLLAVVLVAPGAASSMASASEPEPEPEPSVEIVVVDDDGRRHALVVHDGEVTMTGVDEAPAEAPSATAPTDRRSKRAARRAQREQERSANEARRRARKDLRRAFRDAKRRGEPAPSPREVEAILEQARGPEVTDASSGQVQLHLVVPGEVEVHGSVPLDLQQLEQLEQLDVVIDGLQGVEELEPMFEILEGVEGGELDLFFEGGEGETSLHLRMGPEGGTPERFSRSRARRSRTDAQAARMSEELRQRARAQALRNRQEVERERARARARAERTHEQRLLEVERRRGEVERRRGEAERRRAEVERRRGEAEQDLRRRHDELGRDADRRAREAEREAERVRRRLERRRESEAEGPYVMRVPTPPVFPSAEAPFVLRVPSAPTPPPAPRASSKARVLPPSKPRAPAPPSPTAPVVWVSTST